VERVLNTLRFFANSHQGPEPDATGYQGFYYHFLDPVSGQRARDSELSTVDSAILIAGALLASQFFDQDLPGEREIRHLTDRLYQRMNWNWAQDGEPTVRHGWLPESGFLEFRWRGYDEALLLHYAESFPRLSGEYGLKCSLNPSFPGKGGESQVWFSDHYYGINEGPIVLMVENYRTELLWKLMKGCAPIGQELRKAGFRGGWLS
jgi:hypothetical protein